MNDAGILPLTRLDDPEFITAWRPLEVGLGRDGIRANDMGPVLFLASPLARHVTGAFLLVDGGYLATGMMRDQNSP